VGSERVRCMTTPRERKDTRLPVAVLPDPFPQWEASAESV